MSNTATDADVVVHLRIPVDLMNRTKAVRGKDYEETFSAFARMAIKHECERREGKK